MDIRCIYDDPNKGFCYGRFYFFNLSVRKLSGCKIESCKLRKFYLKEKYKNSQLKFDFA